MKNMQDEGFDPQNVMTWELEVEREMWLERDQSHHEDLLGQGDGGFISYDDDFPPLSDFPCISSSSSSSCSSAPHAPTDLVSSKPIKYSSATCSSSTTTSSSKSSSSSSASSWARAKSSLGGRDHQVDTNQSHHQEGTELQGLHQVDSMDSDCMHVMEELGDMDLDDIWDPSCIFPYEEDHQGLILGGGGEEEDQGNQFLMGGGDGVVQGDDDQGVPSEDLAMVFFEWLKSNKEFISADDLRSIKLKRSTIECAAKRLGGGKEGMKQLLKLILEWVQNHQLQKKKNSADGVFLDCTTIATTTPDPAVAVIVANPTPSAPLENTQPQPQTQFQHTNPPTPLQPDSMANPYNFMPQMQQWSPFPTVMGGYNMGDGGGYPQPDYQTWVHPPPTQQTHFTMPGHPPYMNAYQNHHPVPIPLAPVPPPTFNQYPCQVYPNHAENRLMRLGSSATKEARKKRMARQKRLLSHSRNHYNNQHQVGTEQQARLVNDTDCTNTDEGNWVFWYPTPNVAASPMLMSEAPPAPPPPPQSPPPPTTKPQQRQATSAKRQASKNTSGNEKNLKFLLQKVLKQSDVGNLGRIVLPKKEAETYLPQLEARDGISIAVEDIGTSRVWNMRYRFWPNNKSRMYLLENTGDFVRSNELQEGDFIVIYSDIKCGKYLIRGVKVRQSGSKTETRKQGKTQRYLQAKNSTGIGESSMRETRVMI